jgi:hypothetical protein
MRDDDPIRRRDLARICRDCDRQFIVTASEQDFFRARELSIPNRCPDCRKQRRRADLWRSGADV